MNKKINYIIFLFLGLGFFLGSCSDDDNDNYQVSEEWIAYQKMRVADVVALKNEDGTPMYKRLQTDYGSGMYIYERPSDFITNILEQKVFLEGGPIDGLEVPEKASSSMATTFSDENILEIEFDTDIAVIRYHGYYYTENGKRLVFDSTDANYTLTNSNGKQLNNPREDVVGSVAGYVEGFKTALYNLKVGEEKLFCLPYPVAYGTAGRSASTYNPVPIYGYTTLFFDIKMIEIKRDR